MKAAFFWETSTMLLILRARRVLFIVAAFGLTALLAEGSQAPSIPVVDWTEPAPPPKGAFSVPGDEVGGSPGLKPDAKYPLPLQLTVRSVRRAFIGGTEKLRVEVVLRNIGADPYLLPIARNDATVHAAGNRGRRSWSVAVRLYDASGEVQELPGETAWGSTSIVGSLLRISPAHEVVLRFYAAAPSFNGTGATASSRSYALAAVCNEWASRDDEYRVLARSDTVESSNRLIVMMTP
jgi:hypothetical protein